MTGTDPAARPVRGATRDRLVARVAELEAENELLRRSATVLLATADRFRMEAQAVRAALARRCPAWLAAGIGVLVGLALSDLWP